MIAQRTIEACAQRLGIALIHQELNLVDNLGVGANIFLGREPRRSLGFSLGRHLGWIDRATIDRRSREVLARVGLDVKPGTSVRSLALGQQQLVEIAKAISVESRILIMDEPTSSLSQRESERLFEVIRALSREGVAIIYITHRLSEV
ncbi:MAG: sugar ABC transporter ATP-binding protein, partial [Proteobacteria bacterium]|nr:sugar ABC transporter ATP-binding protein [Pseudomonadota bacterium]